MRPLEKLLYLGDRTLVLFLGMAVGGTIAMSFAGGAGPADRAEANRPASRATVTPAQPARDPLTPRLARAIAQHRKVRIGVFGDSFGEGIWSGLYHQLRSDERFDVLELSERSTGFTRYRSLDLLDDTRSKLDREPVDIAVLSFGANDTQGIYLDGRGHPFMSESWQRIVSERAAAIVRLLRERGITVYWVGLPKMRDAAYDADAQRMNAFYRDLMNHLGVVFIDTAGYSVDGEGRYAAYLPDAATGKPVLIRANDGIHMSYKGYVRITRGLAGRIRSYVDQARAQAGGAAPPPPLVAPPPPEIPPPVRPAAKAPPKFDDPLAGRLDPAVPANQTELPPANGAPADLLPADIGAEPAAEDDDQ